MSSFELGKIPLGQEDYSSGDKLKLGKLDVRTLNLRLNSGKGMVLKDADGNVFANLDQGVTVDLDIKASGVRDISGNANSPTVGSHVTLLDGEMRFDPADGSDGQAYVGLPTNMISTLTSLSMNVRFSLRSLPPAGNFARIVEAAATNSGFMFYIGNNGVGTLQVSHSDSTTSGMNTIGTPFTDLTKIYNVTISIETYAATGLGRLRIYIDGVLNATSELIKAYVPPTRAVYLGTNAANRQFYGSIFDRPKMWDYALTTGEVAAMYAGSSVAYASRNKLNFAINRTAKTITISGIQLENQMEENSGDYVIFDDNVGGLSIDQSGTGGNGPVISLSAEPTIKVRGTYAAKVDCTVGTQNHVWLRSNNLNGVDLSAYDFIAIWFKGANSGKNINLDIFTKNDDANNYYAYFINDNSTDYRCLVFPINLPSMTIGAPDLHQVYRVLLSFTTSGFTSNCSVYVDRIKLVKGRWGYLELGIPDNLQNGTFGGDNIKSYTVQLWNGADYTHSTTAANSDASFGNGNWQSAQGAFWAINGVLAKFGGLDYWGHHLYYKNKRGTSAVKCVGSDPSGANTVLISSKVSTKYRLIIGFKMPPANLITPASATPAGQCPGVVQLQIVVYYK
jgi:hypothetical protein